MDSTFGRTSLAVIAVAALGLSGFSAWQGRAALNQAAEASAMAVKPHLHLEADSRPGPGLRVENIGQGPAIMGSVAFAFAKEDGSLHWMIYPDPANAPKLNFWEYLVLDGVNDGLAEGTQATAALPMIGAAIKPGVAFDLIRFPASLSEAWRARNGVAADRALQSLMICLRYTGIDGREGRMDRGGLCDRTPAETDSRYIGRS